MIWGCSTVICTSYIRLRTLQTVRYGADLESSWSQVSDGVLRYFQMKGGSVSAQHTHTARGLSARGGAQTKTGLR